MSAPPTGLAPQPTTLQLLAQPLRDGLAQIAAQCAIAPDPKGTLTASTVTQLISKTVATQTVAMINGTAVYPAPLATLPCRRRPGHELRQRWAPSSATTRRRARSPIRAP